MLSVNPPAHSEPDALPSSPDGIGRQPRRRRIRPRLSDEAAAHVRELIVSGQLHAGDFIRPEAVAEDLEISATPAREGLLLLQSEGFLEIQPRRGFRVTALSTRDVSDMFEAQALLAGELGARAAQRAKESDLGALRALQARLEQAGERRDLEEIEELNFEFHRAVYQLADAPKILWLLRSTLRYAPRRFFSTIGGWPEATLHDHGDIMAALEKGDPEEARSAFLVHIRSAGQLLVEHLEAREDHPTPQV